LFADLLAHDSRLTLSGLTTFPESEGLEMRFGDLAQTEILLFAEADYLLDLPDY
jgi:hypothetical protein